MERALRDICATLIAMVGIFVVTEEAHATTTITIEMRDADGNLFPRGAGDTDPRTGLKSASNR